MASTERGRERIIGSLRSTDGTGVVRMEGRFDVGVDEAWSALTDPHRLARWLGEFDGDVGPGGSFRAASSPRDGRGRAAWRLATRPLRFEVRTMEQDEPGEQVDEVTLLADGDQTVLVLEERGLPLNQLAAYGATVQIHVEDLADHLAGRDRRELGDRWMELLPAYHALAIDAASAADGRSNDGGTEPV